MSVIAATSAGAARHPAGQAPAAASSAFVSARPEAKKSHSVAPTQDQSSFVSAKQQVHPAEPGATTGQTLDVKL